MKYLLCLPVVLFPYLMLFALYCLYSGFLMESLFANNGFLLLAVVALCGAVAFLFDVVLCALSLAKGWGSAGTARCNMIVKLCQIPAYLVIFVLGVCFFITIFGIPFVLLFTFCDIAAIVMSGLIGAAAAYAAFTEKRLSRSDAIVYALLQFVFCVDIVLCVMLYRRAVRGKITHREGNDGSDPKVV